MYPRRHSLPHIPVAFPAWVSVAAFAAGDQRIACKSIASGHLPNFDACEASLQAVQPCTGKSSTEVRAPPVIERGRNHE